MRKQGKMVFGARLNESDEVVMQEMNELDNTDQEINEKQ